jgi:hypothetical protein
LFIGIAVFFVVTHLWKAELFFIVIVYLGLSVVTSLIVYGLVFYFKSIP